MASGESQLLAYLEATLAQLDALSGEQDADAHASLGKLKEALGATTAPKATAGKGEAVVMDASQLEGLLESLDQQMTALESTLGNLDPESSVLLAEGLSAWQGEAATGGSASTSEPQPALAAVAEGLQGHEEGDEQGNDNHEDVGGQKIDQAAVHLESLALSSTDASSGSTGT